MRTRQASTLMENRRDPMPGTGASQRSTAVRQRAIAMLQDPRDAGPDERQHDGEGERQPPRGATREGNGREHLRLDGERPRPRRPPPRAANTRRGPRTRDHRLMPSTASATEASTANTNTWAIADVTIPNGDRSSREPDLARLAQAPRDHATCPAHTTAQATARRPGCARGMKERAVMWGRSGRGRRWPAKSAGTSAARASASPGRCFHLREHRCREQRDPDTAEAARYPQPTIRPRPARSSGSSVQAVTSSISQKPRWCHTTNPESQIDQMRPDELLIGE